MIKEKVRTKQGQCLICGNKISEEKIEKYYNEPFCKEECESYFYKENKLPRNLKFKFVRYFTKISFVLSTNHHFPTFFQKVILYFEEEGLPEDFVPLNSENLS